MPSVKSIFPFFLCGRSWKVPKKRCLKTPPFFWVTQYTAQKVKLCLTTGHGNRNCVRKWFRSPQWRSINHRMCWKLGGLVITNQLRPEARINKCLSKAGQRMETESTITYHRLQRIQDQYREIEKKLAESTSMLRFLPQFDFATLHSFFVLDFYIQYFNGLLETMKKYHNFLACDNIWKQKVFSNGENLMCDLNLNLRTK